MIACKKFIEKNLKHPSGVADVEGVVFVKFTVNEDGSLTEIKIVRGINDICDEYALEVFRKMPKWIPGQLHNKAEKMKMVFPVKFSK